MGVAALEETDMKHLFAIHPDGLLQPLLIRNREMLIVVSESGDPVYKAEFQRQAKAWETIADEGGLQRTTIGINETPDGGDRPTLEKAIKVFEKNGGDLWLVWIGHGSYDGRTANFNLRGGDIDSKTVAELLKPFERRLIILNLFSASAPFLDILSGENRLIVSSTRSPGQRNYSRFGENLANAISNESADLDLDGEVSLLEAVFEAAAKTEAFYTDAQRVVPENSVIEDNGDKTGTPTSAFRGFRAEMQSEDTTPDGALISDIHFTKSVPENLTDRGDGETRKLEDEIHALHLRKKDLPEDHYYERFETLMAKMAEIYSEGNGRLRIVG